MKQEKNNLELETFKDKVRRAFADFYYSDCEYGCRCCRNEETRKKSEERLAELLGVMKYPDGGGFAFDPDEEEELREEDREERRERGELTEDELAEEESEMMMEELDEIERDLDGLEELEELDDLYEMKEREKSND